MGYGGLCSCSVVRKSGREKRKGIIGVQLTVPNVQWAQHKRGCGACALQCSLLCVK